MSAGSEAVAPVVDEGLLEAQEPSHAEVWFRAGLPGFPDSRRFVLERWAEGGDGPFSVLRCLDTDGLEFLVVVPAVFFPEYTVDLNDETAARLGLERPEDAVVLLIVTVGEDVAKATANLLGPVVVNSRNHEAAQVVLASSGYDVRTPLFR